MRISYIVIVLSLASLCGAVVHEVCFTKTGELKCNESCVMPGTKDAPLSVTHWIGMEINIPGLDCSGAVYRDDVPFEDNPGKRYTSEAVYNTYTGLKQCDRVEDDTCPSISRTYKPFLRYGCEVDALDGKLYYRTKSAEQVVAAFDRL